MKRFNDYDSDIQAQALLEVSQMSLEEKAISALDFLYERCPQNIQQEFREWNLEWAAWAATNAGIQEAFNEDVQ